MPDRGKLSSLFLAVVAIAAPAPASAALAAAAAPPDCKKVVSEFAELLAIPNVADQLPDILRNARHISGMMERRGLSPVLLEREGGGGPPAIYGEWRVPGATRTYVLYAHYDGQPVTPSDWTVTQPFRPVLRSARADRTSASLPLEAACSGPAADKRIYARSASDDKLGVMAILAAVDRFRAANARPAFNLKIFLEGEEEAGSPNLKSILRRHSGRLASDGWIIFDGPAHSSGPPQVVLGVRGQVGLDLTIYGPARPLHSGHYGNWAPNPALALSQLLASMVDSSGRVLVRDFYRGAAPLSAIERKLIARLPDTEPNLRNELALGRTDGKGRSIYELMLLPSLNINGIRAADVGQAGRNVIPSEASASIDLRLPLGIDHGEQVRRLSAHIERQGYRLFDRVPTMDERRRYPRVARLVAKPGYNAERTAVDHPLALAVERAVGTTAEMHVLPTLGGSLPLYLFREVLGAPTVAVSVANSDNNQHAEDENLRLANLWRAIDAATAILKMGE